jgi:hypothetical protein
MIPKITEGHDEPEFDLESGVVKVSARGDESSSKLLGTVNAGELHKVAFYMTIGNVMTHSYAIHYQSKLVGRFIYGVKKNPFWSEALGFCFRSGLSGFNKLDDFYLLDNFDQLLFRFTQREIGFVLACVD